LRFLFVFKRRIAATCSAADPIQVWVKQLGIFTCGHAPCRVLDRKRNIKSDFFVRDYWRASVENNLLGSGKLCTVPVFSLGGSFDRRNPAMKKQLIVSLTIGACLLLPSAGVVFAGSGGTLTGQPGSGDNNHCGMGGLVASPGNSTAPANNSSAFNPTATGTNGQPVGGSRYAGNTASENTTGQLHSAAAMNGGQYDVACLNSTLQPH
jgi:hypothetical protein